MKNPFKFKEYEITMNRVRDTVVFREGEEVLTLKVSADAQRMVAGLTAAQKKMQAINDNTTEDEIRETAEYFAGVIFGSKQAAQLTAFYIDDPAAVISVCGRYFTDRLAGLIANVQKRMKV